MADSNLQGFKEESASSVVPPTQELLEICLLPEEEYAMAMDKHRRHELALELMAQNPDIVPKLSSNPLHKLLNDGASHSIITRVYELFPQLLADDCWHSNVSLPQFPTAKTTQPCSS